MTHALSDPQSQDLYHWLRLRLSVGVGNDTAHRLLKTFGLPEMIFDAPFSALMQEVGEKKAMALRSPPPELDAAWKMMEQWLAGGADRFIWPLNHPQYPQAMLQLVDAPILLYAMGSISSEHLDKGTGLAMVGSRNPTPQGLANARQFARHFGDLGWTVVSGLAMGIDAASHEGALQGASPTVAVVGTGLDRVYPRQNHVLAHQIAQKGMILSEFELGTPPIASNFPRRNRMIAALSKGCLVVEAAMQSGSLITARLCSELGKEVFAIPGSIHAPQSKGCHWLIKQGAQLVDSADDVLQELQGLSVGHAPGRAVIGFPPRPHERASSTAVQSRPPSLLAPDAQEDALLQAIGFDPVGLDSLQARTGLTTDRLQARLFELELAGLISRQPGGFYQRVHHV